VSGRRPVQRGEVYDARLDPIEGSEQGGTRPVIVMTRDAINQNSRVVVVVPCTTYRPGRHIYRSQALLIAPDGGLETDSLALGEQVRAIAVTRLLVRRGVLSRAALERVERALLITLDLPLHGDE
jgi:mRNA interferase MazF